MEGFFNRSLISFFIETIEDQTRRSDSCVVCSASVQLLQRDIVAKLSLGELFVCLYTMKKRETQAEQYGIGWVTFKILKTKNQLTAVTSWFKHLWWNIARSCQLTRLDLFDLRVQGNRISEACVETIKRWIAKPLKTWLFVFMVPAGCRPSFRKKYLTS